GDELQWPLTNDEPVVKLDALHYLFSLPMTDGEEPLSYGQRSYHYFLFFFLIAMGFLGNRFGENAGEATGHALATAGHCAGTAWNVLKIRKAINPASTVSSGVLNSTKKSKNSS
ncbi:hypothetical protein C3L33_03601, partial [Rhododendron williamsianum]